MEISEVSVYKKNIESQDFSLPGPLSWDNASWFLRQTLGVDIAVPDCAAAAQHRRHLQSDRFVVRPKLEEEGLQGWRKWQLHLFSFFLPGFLLWRFSLSHSWVANNWESFPCKSSQRGLDHAIPPVRSSLASAFDGKDLDICRSRQHSRLQGTTVMFSVFLTFTFFSFSLNFWVFIPWLTIFLFPIYLYLKDQSNGPPRSQECDC